jgi:hypothetical protein
LGQRIWNLLRGAIEMDYLHDLAVSRSVFGEFCDLFLVFDDLSSGVWQASKREYL